MTQLANRPPAARMTLIIAFLSFIAIGLQGGAMNVAWLYMQDSFERSLESLGILLIAMTVGGLLVSFFSGRMIALWGLNRFCITGAALLSLSLLITAVTPFWSVLVVSAAIWGIGRAAINAGVNTYVAQNYPVSRMNWLHAIFGVGSTLGPLLVTLTVVQLGQSWQVSYLILAAVQFMVLLLFGLTFHAWKLDEDPSDDTRSTPLAKPSMRETLSLLPVWLGTALFISHTGLQISVGQLSNNLLVEGRGIDPAVAGLWISLFWGFLTLGRLIFGSLIDHYGMARVLRLCTLISLVGAIFIWWNLLPAFSFIGIALAGFGLAPIFPSSVSRTPQLVGKRNSPNAIGIQMAGAALGGALIPGFIAYLGDNLGLSIIPISFIVVAVLQLLLHEFVSLQERQAHAKETSCVLP